MGPVTSLVGALMDPRKKEIRNSCPVTAVEETVTSASSAKEVSGHSCGGNGHISKFCQGGKLERF